jgi:predicted Zn-dependent peptidase
MMSCRRFQDANPEEIEALTLEGMRDAVMAQLQPSNLEVNIVGDLDLAELDLLAPRYLGTMRGVPPVQQPPQRPIQILCPPANVRQQKWHLKDSDERSCAYIAGMLTRQTVMAPFSIQLSMSPM